MQFEDALAHTIRRAAVTGAAIVAVGGLAWLTWLFWPRPVQPPVLPAMPTVVVGANAEQRVRIPGQTLLGLLGVYDDELFAFLMFDYLRSRPKLAASELFLDYVMESGAPAWRVRVICANDLLVCVPWLAELKLSGLAESTAWAFVIGGVLQDLRRQTRLFVNAYSAPVEARFESLSPARRVQYVRRFLRFKSSTDPRVRRGNPEIRPLTKNQAFELAADIVTIADFYDLPLDLFLGIGAMENNYMNVSGDLDHAVWKRRAEAGDIVIRRRGGRVLVKNFSTGVWQITRETLRMAHSLYLADSRDYNNVPARLRPDRTLDLDHMETPALTTYAGILLRYLVDYFHGDVSKAIGAYNGGVNRPNEKYESGVRHVAEYARRIFSLAAAKKDASVASVQAPP